MPLLLYDGGNLMSPVKKYPRLYAELYLQALNHMGYQAMNIGVWELHRGREHIAHMAELADFPLISANIRDAAADWRPYVIDQADGVRVAAIGSISQRLVHNNAAVTIESPVEIVRQVIDRVKEQSDVIILISHMTVPQVREIIEACPELAIVFMAHVKKEIPGERIGDTLIVSPGKKGESVSSVDVVWDATSRRITRMTPGIHPLDDTIAADPAITALVGPFNAKVEAKRNADYQQRKRQAADINAMVTDSLKMTPEEFFKTYGSQLNPTETKQP